MGLDMQNGKDAVRDIPVSDWWNYTSSVGMDQILTQDFTVLLDPKHPAYRISPRCAGQ